MPQQEFRAPTGNGAPQEKMLEKLFEGFGHGAFGVFSALLLVVLVSTNVIPKIVAVSLAAA